MKKLLVVALALSVMMIGVAAVAQDTMGQAPTKATAAPLKSTSRRASRRENPLV